jgi:hypothetical protein
VYLFTAKAQRTQKLNLFAWATILATSSKLKLISQKLHIYSLLSFLSAGILGGSTAENKKKTSLRP